MNPGPGLPQDSSTETEDHTISILKYGFRLYPRLRELQAGLFRRWPREE
jgi:hypothetical protein